jgi:hypothetical protein
MSLLVTSKTEAIINLVEFARVARMYGREGYILEKLDLSDGAFLDSISLLQKFVEGEPSPDWEV